ncbi:MAG: YdeI/OmpD-associated family protein [Acidimicrobiales bacterium]|jgi:hypothetical protein
MAKEFTNPGPQSFRSPIVRNGEVANSSAFIEFPHDLKELFGVGNLVPVSATFDGRVTYQGSLAKMGGPKAVLVLRKDVRDQLGKGPGDSVDVVLELDDRPRTVELPDDVATALADSGEADAFEALAYTHRKEFVRWIEEAKRPETRQRRIEQTCEMVHAGKTR